LLSWPSSSVFTNNTRYREVISFSVAYGFFITAALLRLESKILEAQERDRADHNARFVLIEAQLAKLNAGLEVIREERRLIRESPAAPVLKEVAGLQQSIDELGATTAVVREILAGLAPTVEEVGVGVGQLLQRQGAHPPLLLPFTSQIFLVVASYSHCLLINPVMTHIGGNVYNYSGRALGQCSIIDQSRSPSDGIFFSFPFTCS